MPAIVLADDYLDPDVAYLLGMIVARGTLLERQRIREIIIEFPYQHLQVDVSNDDTKPPREINVPQSIELGLTRIRERALELLDCDISINRLDNSIHMVMTMTRRTIAWRNILLQLNNRVSYRTMDVPQVLFHPDVSSDMRLEFIRGYADVAGNVRPANCYVDGRNRVRLDVLNDNWRLPVQLCRLLQVHLNIPVQNITWGHPNLGHGLREHQLNIFVTPFQRIGFSFEHKQQILTRLVGQDRDKQNHYAACPGRRVQRRQKPNDPDENSERLPKEVRGHFDAYWQICKAMGCLIEPSQGESIHEEVEES
jgi:hypothetical protein